MADIFGGTLQLMRDNPTPGDNMDRASQLNAHLSSIAANAFMNAQERAVQERTEMQTRAGFIELGKYLSGVTDWSDPKAEAGAWNIVSKNPWVAKSPMFPHVMENFKASRLAKAAATSREAIASDMALARTAVADETSRRRLSELQWKLDNGVTPTIDDRAWLEGLKQQSIESRQLNVTEARGLVNEQRDAARHALENNGVASDRIIQVGGTTWLKSGKTGYHKVGLFNQAEEDANKDDRKGISILDKAISETSDETARGELLSKKTGLVNRVGERKTKAEKRLVSDLGRLNSTEGVPINKVLESAPETTPTVEPPPAAAPIPGAVAPPPDAAKGELTPDQANAFLKAAGGDEEKATAIAVQAGYKLPTSPIAQPAPAMRQNLLPWEPDKSKRVEGELYDTDRGPLVWTGTQWQK